MASAESNGSMRRDVMSAVSMSAQDTRKLEMAVDISEGSDITRSVPGKKRECDSHARAPVRVSKAVVQKFRVPPVCSSPNSLMERGKDDLHRDSRERSCPLT